MLLQTVLAVKALLADGALEAVGGGVEPLMAPAGARLGETFPAVATWVRQLVTGHPQQVLAEAPSLQPPPQSPPLPARHVSSTYSSLSFSMT